MRGNHRLAPKLTGEERRAHLEMARCMGHDPDKAPAARADYYLLRLISINRAGIIEGGLSPAQRNRVAADLLSWTPGDDDPD